MFSYEAGHNNLRLMALLIVINLLIGWEAVVMIFIRLDT